VADLTKLGTTPIAGENPAGSNVRLDTEFDKLKAQMDKLESVNPDVEWSEVVRLASSILAEKSKDVLVAAYLTAGLFETDGYSGLSTGFRICKDLMTTFWENCFPEKNRMRGRLSPMTWIAERCDKIFPDRPTPDESDREPLQAALADVRELSQFLAEKAEGDQPNFPLLERLLDDKLGAIPEPQTESAETTKETSTPAATEPPPPAKLEIDSPDSAREALGEIREMLLKAAQVLREADWKDPLPYRLARLALWGWLLEIPSPPGSGIDADFAALMEQRLSKRDYAGVLAEVESRLPGDPYWLDLHLLASRAMEGLGFEYDPARKRVCEEVGAFARRFPALLELRFESEAPLASAATRIWIQNELLVRSTETGDAEFDKKLQDARALAARSKFTEAVCLLNHQVQTAGSRRERFLWRLHLARMCMESGKTALALPVLESLDAEAQRIMLDDWEPTLCAEMLKLHCQCLRTVGDEASAEKSKKLYARLSSLDLSEALSLDGTR